LILLFARNVLGLFDPGLESILRSLFDATFGVSGLLFVACMAAHLSKGIQGVEPMQGFVAGLLSVILLLTGKDGLSVLPERLGPPIILMGAFAVSVAIWLLQFMAKRNIAERIGRAVPPGVATELSNIISLLVVGLLSWGFVRFLPFDLYQVLLDGTHFLVSVFDTWYCVLIIMFVFQLLWFSGMHGGSSMVWGLMLPFMIMIIYGNALQVFSHGTPTGIVSQPFVFTFLMPTGVGITLPLALIFRKAKTASLQEMAAVSLKSGLFGINETVLFGTPVLRNRFFLFPFVIVAPIVGTLYGYFLTTAGMIKTASVQVPWTTPIFLQPFLATGFDVPTVAAQGLLILIMYLIWLPYAKRWEKHLLLDEALREEQ
jgi:PTS system cellobiose-specific IIC component